MDNLTHSLFALTLGRTELGRAGRGTTAALLVASNAPDIDVLSTLGGATQYLRWHRGPTHGPLGLVALSLLTGGAVWMACRLLDRRRNPSGLEPPSPVPVGTASFAMLTMVSAIGVLMHILMDLPTSYGTRLLSPFDWHWYGVDWMPIVDVFLLIPLASGLAFGRRSPAARQRNAAIILVFMAANYAVRAAEHHQALELAPRLFGPLLPAPCAPETARRSIIDVWPHDGNASGPAGSASRCLVEIAALPTFVSPFRWRVIAQMSNAYEIHDIDLLDSRFRHPASGDGAFWRLSLRYPNQWTAAVFEAAPTRIGRVFLGFSRFPSARSVVDRDGQTTVRWSDMRFVGGVFGLDQPARQMNFTTAMVRIAPDGTILLEKFGR